VTIAALARCGRLERVSAHVPGTDGAPPFCAFGRSNVWMIEDGRSKAVDRKRVEPWLDVEWLDLKSVDE
jgi:hypothetical protein